MGKLQNFFEIFGETRVIYAEGIDGTQGHPFARFPVGGGGPREEFFYGLVGMAACVCV